MALVWLGKYIALRNIIKSIPDRKLEETVDQHLQHIIMATDAIRTPNMGRRVSNGIIGALFGAESHSANRY